MNEEEKIEVLDEVESLDDAPSTNPVNNNTNEMVPEFKGFEVNGEPIDTGTPNEISTPVVEDIKPPVEEPVINQNMEQPTNTVVRPNTRIVNNVSDLKEDPITHQPLGNVSEEPVEEPKVKTRTGFAHLLDKAVLIPTLILLIFSIINEFFLAPRFMLKGIYKLFETMFESLVNGGSSQMAEITYHVVLIAIISYSIFSFLLLIYSVITIITKGEFVTKMINHIVKILICSFLVGTLILLCDKYLKTDIYEPVMRVTTFNGKTLESLELMM